MLFEQSVPSRLPLAPIRAGTGPLLTLCAALAATLSACVDVDENQVTGPIVLGMTPQLAPSYDDGQQQLYQVQIPVPLPVRKPETDEISSVKSDPYPRFPFVGASDVRIEIRYTISNLDDQPHDVELLLDPWNEFTRYRPGIVVTDEAAIPNLSGYDRLFKVAPKSRLIGTLTADDMNELATDLATAQNILAHPPADPMANLSGLINRGFNIQNRSNVSDPLVSPYIPGVIAGLTGFDLGLRTSAPATVAVEILMDITDLNGNRIIPAGISGTVIGMPARQLTPPGARPL